MTLSQLMNLVAGGTTSVPEFDGSAGIAAAALLVSVVLVLRNRATN